MYALIGEGLGTGYWGRAVTGAAVSLCISGVRLRSWRERGILVGHTGHYGIGKNTFSNPEKWRLSPIQIIALEFKVAFSV